MDTDLPGKLAHPSLDVMNFLNEVVLRHPEAISFAPGRPAEELLDVASRIADVDRFVAHRSAVTGSSREAVLAGLGQYNRTNGVVHDLVAAQLAADEAIDVAPESIVVTNGCQEAMLVLLMGLFDRPAGGRGGEDVLLVSDPTYIGITGAARLLDIPLVPVPMGPDGLEPERLAAVVAEVRASGRRPRAVYDIPDFNNPMGTSMPAPARRRLLDLAGAEDLLLIEDNPYGMFAYDGPPARTLKSMDEKRRVIYLGSFSKTLCPGLRLGYLVADQRVPSSAGGEVPLAVELSKVKSLTTVTTSPLTQAMAGGFLLGAGGSLAARVAGMLPFYRRNRDRMLAALERTFGPPGAGSPVTWNRPSGGFFLTVTLPFAFTEERLEQCAGEFGVICCPVSFFALAAGWEDRIRLAFSYVTPDQIDEGVERLGRFVAAVGESRRLAGARA